jgi:CHAD domain-containing protein
MSPRPLEQHLHSILEKRLAQLAEALEHARRGRAAEAVEAVHDLRVASRRLRAFGVTFRELITEKTRRRLEKTLKRVTRAVGPQRDLDVQLELVEGRLGAAASELDRGALEHLLEFLELRKAQGSRRAERRLGKVQLDAISRHVHRASRAVNRGLSERDAEAYALSVLDGLVADAADQMPADGAEDPERLHRLRIDIKELRYALELFEPMLGSRFEGAHARATALQEVLGAYHDLVVLAEVVTERITELRERQRDALARGLDHALEALATERKAVLARILHEGFDPESWRALLRPDALQQHDAP